MTQTDTRCNTKDLHIPDTLFQHHRGRATRQEKWVFGVDTSIQPALGIMMLMCDLELQYGAISGVLIAVGQH